MRRQRMPSMMIKVLTAVGVTTVSWIVVGSSLAFSGDGAVIGNPDLAFMSWAGTDPLGGGSSERAIATFQTMFAVILAAIVLGAATERNEVDGGILVPGYPVRPGLRAHGPPVLGREAV